MEEEKKKKKNKKKRGKQAKTTDDVVVGPEETSLPEQNHVTELQQNHCTATSGKSEVDQNSMVSEVDAKLDRREIDEAKGITSLGVLEEGVRQLEAEKHSWLQREGVLEEGVRQLEAEKHSWLQREGVLEEGVKQLEAEKHSWLQKERWLEEEIKKAVSDKHSWIFKEASLEDKIKCLQNERGSCIQREAYLEKKIGQLQSEIDSWIQKEASSEEKIKQLQSEQNTWNLKENSAKETIARLNELNIQLQTQVDELENSKSGLLEENQRLRESISLLELRVPHREREGSPSGSSAGNMPKHGSNCEDSNNLIEAARALVEKLVVENAELVEKVNELCIELDRHNETAPQSSTIRFDPVMLETSGISDSLPEQKVLESGEEMESPAIIPTIPTEDTVVDFHNVDTESNVEVGIRPEDSPESYNASETKEIVLVPLSENEVLEVESELAESSEKLGIPLSDAPLIGAPFRLFSFVAKYVSGADLADKNRLNSRA
ncbi:mitochondrial ATP synthase D chain-related protein isoform X2 [Tasmannia lanceolata]|uniref:mitochondrial ATP synthase D chain-related protein isoform X2 n=1 Tax=Tasmannia lanceolata TaxID=3420 RepID=UPI004062E80F